MNNRITIKKTQHGDGTCAVYRGSVLIATISGEKPTRCNGRADFWCIAWTTGRVEWFGAYGEARDCALKGN